MPTIDCDAAGIGDYFSATEVMVDPVDPGVERNAIYTVRLQVFVGTAITATPGDGSHYAFGDVAPPFTAIGTIRSPASGPWPDNRSSYYYVESHFVGDWQETKDRFDAGAVSIGTVGARIIDSLGDPTTTMDVTVSGVETVSYVLASPEVISVDPPVGPPDEVTSVTIHGHHFDESATVDFNGIAATSVVVVDSDTITCDTPALSQGLAAVKVTIDNEGLKSGTLDPGFDFTTLTVKFGSTFGIGATVIDSTHMSVIAPAHAAGTVRMEVLKDGDVFAFLDDAYEFIQAGISISPTIGSSFGDTLITLTGEDLVPGATITIDGEPAVDVTYVDAETYTFKTFPHSPGMVDIVYTPAIGDPETRQFQYHVFPSFTPPGSSPDGGELITIKRWFSEEEDGTEFIPGASVTIGGTPATDVTFIDVDTYTCIAPPHAAGLVDVVIEDISSLGLTMLYEDSFAYGSSVGSATIDAGPDKVAHGPAPSVVSVLAKTSDPSMTFLWEQTGGPQAAVISSPTTLGTNLTFNEYIPGVYTFRITGSFVDMPSVADSMAVTIQPPEVPRIRITVATP